LSYALIRSTNPDDRITNDLTSIGRFVEFALSTLRRQLAAADVLSDNDRVAIVRALDLVFCSHTVHGKSLQSSSQVARSTEAGRAAAAARGESSAALTGGAGLDAIGVKEYTAYTSTCYDARSLDPINTDAATRPISSITAVTHSTPPLVGAEKLDDKLGLKMDTHARGARCHDRDGGQSDVRRSTVSRASCRAGEEARSQVRRAPRNARRGREHDVAGQFSFLFVFFVILTAKNANSVLNNCRNALNAVDSWFARAAPMFAAIGK
jgi:hypothetical protein